MLSYLAMWRRGFGSGLRGAAWSLLPTAAYLTGAGSAQAPAKARRGKSTDDDDDLGDVADILRRHGIT